MTSDRARMSERPQLGPSFPELQMWWVQSGPAHPWVFVFLTDCCVSQTVGALCSWRSVKAACGRSDFMINLGLEHSIVFSFHCSFIYSVIQAVCVHVCVCVYFNFIYGKKWAWSLCFSLKMGEKIKQKMAQYFFIKFSFLENIFFSCVIYPNYSFLPLYLPASPPICICPLSVSHWKTNRLIRNSNKIYKTKKSTLEQDNSNKQEKAQETGVGTETHWFTYPGIP